MVYGHIYKIENLVNGKVYIGQTVQDPTNRKHSHLSQLKNSKHWNRHLQNAFNKYGEENFKFNVLNYATNKDVLDQLEDDYIVYYDCLNPEKGYNFKRGGANGKCSEELRKKMSESKKGEKNPNYGKYGILNPMYGKTHSLETRKKLSEIMSGKNHPFYGKKHSMETRKKMSESAKGKTFSIETRRKISEAQKGKKIPLETRKKMSKTRTGMKCPPEHNFKMSLIQRGKGLFKFTGVHLEKRVHHERKCWYSIIKYDNRAKSLGSYEDPLSAEIVHDLVLDAIYSY